MISITQVTIASVHTHFLHADKAIEIDTHTPSNDSSTHSGNIAPPKPLSTSGGYARAEENAADINTPTAIIAEDEPAEATAPSTSLNPCASNFVPTSSATTAVPIPTETQSSKNKNIQDACSVCQKTGQLKQCGGCGVVKYCSKICQGLDWSSHKLTCAGRRPQHQTRASDPQFTTDISPNGFTAMLMPGNEGLFVNQSRANVFRRLIDLYRLRVEDTYVWGGEMIGLYETLTNGEDDEIPLEHFKSYLKKAERCTGFLPTWWNKQAEEECIKIACDPNGNSYIGHTVEKSDIQEAYNDSSMPMFMRLLGERIFGSPVGSV